MRSPDNSTPYHGLTIDAAKRLVVQKFTEGEIETPKLDARLLLAEVLGFDHADLIAKSGEVLTSRHAAHLEQITQRRLCGEPIDHILGYREFYGRLFKVTKDVLTPRPETEGLIDQALALYDEQSAINCLDLGTGSGAIILTLLAERPNWRGVAVDLSAAALEVAKNNALNMGLAERVNFIQGSWCDGVEGQFDLIASNPPYIDKAHMERLSDEVQIYDPPLSLYGGPDGLAAYREIVSQAPHYLKENGRLILEIGYDQKESVGRLLRGGPFKDVTCHADLAGLDRIITADVKVM